MARMNYKAPLMTAMKEAGFNPKTSGQYARVTFTHLRKNGQRRLKLWLADDVWEATQEKQKKLDAALKKHYGAAYLGGYFIEGPYWACCKRSFCVVLRESAFK